MDEQEAQEVAQTEQKQAGFIHFQRTDSPNQTLRRSEAETQAKRKPR
jgi:hypothetical protein